MLRVGNTTNVMISHRLGSGGTLDYVPNGRDQPVIYGPIDTRNLRQDKDNNVYAERIADSYTWFANEVYWTATCERGFDDPEKGDDQDPDAQPS